MRLLLDTHVLLWWLADDPALPESHRRHIGRPKNDVFVSAITLAEISLKSSLGKLELPAGFDDAVASSGFEDLPFTSEHALTLRELPWHHRDPFDRMLIAQARSESLVFASMNSRNAEYGVRIL